MDHLVTVNPYIYVEIVIALRGILYGHFGVSLLWITLTYCIEWLLVSSTKGPYLEDHPSLVGGFNPFEKY